MAGDRAISDPPAAHHGKRRENTVTHPIQRQALQERMRLSDESTHITITVRHGDVRQAINALNGRGRIAAADRIWDASLPLESEAHTGGAATDDEDGGRDVTDTDDLLARADYWLANAPCETAADGVDHDLIRDLRAEVKRLQAEHQLEQIGWYTPSMADGPNIGSLIDDKFGDDDEPVYRIVTTRGAESEPGAA